MARAAAGRPKQLDAALQLFEAPGRGGPVLVLTGDRGGRPSGTAGPAARAPAVDAERAEVSRLPGRGGPRPG